MKTWFVTQVLPSLYLNDAFDRVKSGLNNFGGKLTGVLLIFGGVMIVVGSYYYSGGEEGKSKGKKIWLRVGGAVAIALIALGIISYIQDVMGSDGGFS
ncbi:hypothetical protein [Limosilactobacillus fastidiosus]|uniref:Uncharacterized protein n=1 Tax=Limosilactobacillus fastidiosus TaxID=2759855 RepID=A0A7W3YBM3_9LACO|nr:hypothetical protein [Limosilactobacillus fastidiosus]MBB1062399.1 hypothetical protein [Limosilactobacillus fastidiosus]MBB1085305.1 hypothetical protein [Limosilactobacillus fastidiosus]MCD7083474.1 hypothetical protein [Limosilactobacillus fastidiosus]MCD7085289.1 hypothetical protein [Limosilactobacillus fastidiosus]MCD7115232.1 hypothetical protein [Limosilactobacillus fastidiosus]